PRARGAKERGAPSSVALWLAAGVANVMLVFAVSALMRESFILLSLVPFLSALSLLAIVFGSGGLALAFGGWLRTRLGDVHPLIAALVAALAMYDVALVPVAGWIALAVVAVTAL